MNCPKCNSQMLRVGIGEISEGKVFATFECQKCHFRTQSTDLK